MTDASMPVEILEAIIEDFVSSHKADALDVPEQATFLPQWYITPLLRVCKLWHIVFERHLYQSISVGWDFHRGTRGEALEATPTRRDSDVAKDLLHTLMANPRLAAIVKDLRLGYMHSETLRTNIRILQNCPNVKHVYIRGVYADVSDDLTAILKEKSLVSFRLNHFDLLSSVIGRSCSSRLSELMQSWPNLQSIIVNSSERLMEDTRTRELNVSNCCHDLQEIIITDCIVLDSDLHSLRTMCHGVTTFSIYIPSRSGRESVLKALYECLRAWSPSLRYLQLRLEDGLWLYEPFWAALSALKELQELIVGGAEIRTDLGPIARLARLERLHYAPRFEIIDVFDSEPLVCDFAGHLEDPKKFPALKHIVINPIYGRQFDDRLGKVCERRNIKLEQSDLSYRKDIPGFVL